MSLSKLWELLMGGLACYNPWGHKESDTTKLRNPKSPASTQKNAGPLAHTLFVSLTLISVCGPSHSKYFPRPTVMNILYFFPKVP